MEHLRKYLLRYNESLHLTNSVYSEYVNFSEKFYLYNTRCKFRAYGLIFRAKQSKKAREFGTNFPLGSLK